MKKNILISYSKLFIYCFLFFNQFTMFLKTGKELSFIVKKLFSVSLYFLKLFFFFLIIVKGFLCRTFYYM